MNKNKNPLELAEALTSRSICNVQVGSVIFDRFGIFSWGWNHLTTPPQYGKCAEAHAISRASRRRLIGATIVIVSKRRGKRICSIPCNRCRSLIRAAGIKFIWCYDKDRNQKRYAIN